MKIIELLNDFSVPYYTTGAKCTPGWVQLDCPYCTGNPGPHLGFFIEGNRFNCWRCGPKPLIKTLSTLLNLPYDQTRGIVRQYRGNTRFKFKPTRAVRAKAFKFPSNTGEMQAHHKRYLERRGFDPDKLIAEWGLLASGPISLLDEINYSHRIIAPIFWNGKMVSFQGRDITNKHQRKYMACPQDRELIHHKDILYGNSKGWNGTGICVEGITDVWRFGIHAFATLGTGFKIKQRTLITKLFTRVCVVFDNEPAAHERAKEMVSELVFWGMPAWVETVENDPGSMKQEEADYFVKEVLG